MNLYTRLRAWMRTPAPDNAGPMESARRTSAVSVHHTGSVSTDGGSFANTGITLTAHGVGRAPVIPDTRVDELRHAFTAAPYVTVSRAAANYAEVLLLGIERTGRLPAYVTHDPARVDAVRRALSSSIDAANLARRAPADPPAGLYDSEHGLDEMGMGILGVLKEIRYHVVTNRGANDDDAIIAMIDAYALGLHGDEEPDDGYGHDPDGE